MISANGANRAKAGFVILPVKAKMREKDTNDIMHSVGGFKTCIPWGVRR